ncbi:MAG: NAD(P)/FAD-dependent oxidoreductase [Burkholderiaceae bacterium]
MSDLPSASGRSTSVEQPPLVLPPPIVPAVPDQAALRALRERARDDLAMLNFPAPDWVPGAPGRAPSQVDVLIVGGGMCGQTAAYALLRDGVRTFRIIDAAARGDEGPWGTFARMLTLRSPKHLTGADLGVPSLTYRAWHEAAYGVEHWQSLHKITTLDWRDYLLWVRETVGVGVENGVRMTAVRPRDEHVEVDLIGPDGPQRVTCRKLVLAMGRDGSGGERWPRIDGLDPASPARAGRVFHSDEAIDFAALRGRRVAVLGAGASAFDNAAAALEAGAAQVDQFVRRPFLPQVNKSKWTSFPGFLHGFIDLDDARRWAFYTYIFDEQVPPPWESVQRCDRHPQFSLRFGHGWQRIDLDGDGMRITLTAAADAGTGNGTGNGNGNGNCDDAGCATLAYDAAIVATGFDVDLTRRPELAGIAGDLLRWADRIGAERAAAHPEPARFPYLGDGFELRERVPGTAPGLRHVHLFNWGATMSHGAIAGDIPGLGLGATRLSHAIVKALFVADADRHYARMLAHNEDELAQTRRFVPLDERGTRTA